MQVIFMKNLYIDLLGYETGKAYGYNEYINNILDYLYGHRYNILFDTIVLVIPSKEIHTFYKYTDKFTIRSFNTWPIHKRIYYQNFWPLYVSMSSLDVIFCSCNYAPLILKGKMVLVIHDLLFKHRGLLSSSMMTIQREIYVPLSAYRAKKIICISNFTRDEVNSYYPKCSTKTTVIYNYFNFKKFGDIDALTFKTLKKQGILSVCSSAYHKNTITVLRAFEAYCRKGGIYDLILVGKIPVKTELAEFMNIVDENIKRRIHIHTGISNLELGTLYKTQKIYVSASKFEGLGMPIVEAMYFDMQIILPDKPAIFREIGRDQVHYFDANNPQELCETFLSIQNMDNVPQYNLELFSPENTVERYIHLLNTI